MTAASEDSAWHTYNKGRRKCGKLERDAQRKVNIGSWGGGYSKSHSELRSGIT